MNLIVPNGNMVVRKSEVLLNARYSLGELALKLVSIIYSNIKRSDEAGKYYEMKVTDIAKLMGKDYGEIYYLLDRATDELLENPVRIIIGKDKKGKKEWEKFNWISYAKYKNGIISFAISQELKPYILELQEKFVKYNLENILNLKGVYLIRLYEILKDELEKNSRYGNKTEKIYSLEEIKEKLEIPRSYNYGNSSGIKKRILEKAKVQFAEHTDIIFDYEEIKTGRKVTHLKFTILPNPKRIGDDYNKKNEKHFKNRANFVSLLRKNYSGNGKYFGYKTIEGKNWWLGINNDGLMYATLGEEIKNLNSSESGEIYDIWFKIAQNSALYQDFIKNGVCLKEVYNENRELYSELVKDINLLKAQGTI